MAVELVVSARSVYSEIARGQGQAGHQSLFLLPVQAHQLAVMLLGDAGSLKDRGLQLLGRPSGVKNQKVSRNIRSFWLCSSFSRFLASRP